jgi:hypothetical protein
VHCQTHVEARQDMRDHLDVHKITLSEAAENRVVQQGPGQPLDVLAPPPQRSTTERISRPKVSEGSDDIQWETFTKQFARYKRVCGIQGQQAVDQLWYCMSEALEDAVSQDGVEDHITEVLLMEKIKKLAVRRANVLVNQAKFLKLGQDRDEDCGAFVARLRGAAR